MPMITLDQMQEILRRIGHGMSGVGTSRKGWHAFCACGYRSPRVGSQDQAEQMLAGHMQIAVKTWNRLPEAQRRRLSL